MFAPKIHSIGQFLKALFIMINTYDETHIGHLPVRVLQHRIIAAFEGTNPALLNYSKILIQNQNLDPEIGYTINKSSSDGLPIIGPHVKSKIYLDETFLAYVWCVCYVLYVETNNLMNPKAEYDSQKSCKLFNFALRLKTEYVDWDKSVYINPEKYLPIDKDDIEKTNAIFQNAVAFILCHEFSHIVLAHNKSDKNNELEADRKAIDLMFDGCNSANEPAVKYGITYALCVSIFLRNKLGSQTHPDSHDRIIKALDRLNIDKNDICWAVACISLNVWQGQFDKVATWEDQGSFKETFIHVSQQLVKADTKPGSSQNLMGG
jgi:hypothetical protein